MKIEGGFINGIFKNVLINIIFLKVKYSNNKNKMNAELQSSNILRRISKGLFRVPLFFI